MRKIRVLIVDDSAIIRQTVSDELGLDPEIEIAGTAPNGQIALAKMTQVNPDFVLLDVEMPVLDGLKTLCELKKTHRRIPVMMFSSLTERGADATLDALLSVIRDVAEAAPGTEGGDEGVAAVLRTSPWIDEIRLPVVGNVFVLSDRST